MHPILALGLISAALGAGPLQRPDRTLHLPQAEDAPPPVLAVHYERVAQNVAITELAGMLRRLAEEARVGGRLVFEGHEVELVGELELKPSYLEWARPGYPRYSFAIDLKIGGGRLLRPLEEHGARLWSHEVIADDEITGLSAAQVADYLDAVAADLVDGILEFEGHQLEMGSAVELRVFHTVSGSHDVQGVQIGVSFGETIPRDGLPRQAWVESYRRESEFMSAAQVGAVLEQIGREMQQNASLSLGGAQLDATGGGLFQISARQDPSGRSFFQIEFVTGRADPIQEKEFFVPYERRSQDWAASDVARSLAGIAETLAATGRFELEDAIVEFRGTASVEQKLIERFDPGERQHTFQIDINLGPQALPRPLAEYAEDIGSINVLAKDEAAAVGPEEVARLLGSLSSDLAAGRIQMAGQEFSVDRLDFRFKQTSSLDRQSHRLQFAFFFGPSVSDAAPGARAAQAPPRSHARESRDVPMEEIAALLQRIGSEVMSNGAFSMDGMIFRTADEAYLEVSVVEGRGLEIIVTYAQPRPIF